MRQYAMVAEYHEYVDGSLTLVRETCTHHASDVRKAINDVQAYIMEHRNVVSVDESKNKDKDIVITNIYSEED